MKYKNNENYDYDYPDASEEYTIDRKTKLNYKNNHNFKLSMDYNISPEHLLGIQLSGQLRNIHSDIYNTNKILNDQNSTTFISDQDRNTNRKYYSSTIYYSFIPKSKKSSFNILYDKSDFNNRNITDINENQVLKMNYDKADINMNAVKADWQTKLSGNWIFNAGGKYSYVTNSSTIRFTNNETETSAINYKYKENIGALYVLLSRQLNKISYEGGVRMETTGNKAWDNGTIIHKKNSNVDLFPSLSIAYRLYKDWSLSASYATKINRPTFQDMNPAINYIDSLSYFQGNPNLVPEKQYAGNFKVSYKSYVSIGFSYIHRNNMLAWYVEQDKTYPAITKATEKNIDKSDTYSIDLVLPYQNKWLTCYVATGVILTNSNDKEAEIIDLNKPMWYAYSEFDMNLPHDMKLGTNIRYYTKGVENVYYFDPEFRMDLSLQKNFLKNKLTATLLWNDIFSSDKMNTYTTFGTRYVRYNYYLDQSVVQLSLTYRFKTAKAKYKSKSSLNEENNRIKGF
jgi:iron complex outermembrane recepter protein